LKKKKKTKYLHENVYHFYFVVFHELNAFSLLLFFLLLLLSSMLDENQDEKKYLIMITSQELPRSPY
jgi:hypothetical protein